MADTERKPDPLTDRFGREITYLRLSVTDRCDFRCTYCMSETMRFLPKKDVLSLEELTEIGEAFIRRGVQKIRITGGEPLVRPGILTVFEHLGDWLGEGLNELTLTTNATQLRKYAKALHSAGVRRVNVSLDTLDAEQFKIITRRDNLHEVLAGIDAAQTAGLKVKINTVALKNQNDREIPSLIEWAHSNSMDITLIEVMPLADTGDSRFAQYIPLTTIRDNLEKLWTLEDLPAYGKNNGPARYVRKVGSDKKIGFITPLSGNFCAGCNRVRVTCTGRIYMCLGHDDFVDLRSVLRNNLCIDTALNDALGRKAEKHVFEISENAVVSGTKRHMSTTGG